MSVMTDIVDDLARQVRDGANINETVDSYINGCGFAICVEILNEIGDVDLSEPIPDLKAGWSSLLKQLAYNALYCAVILHGSKLDVEWAPSGGES